MTCTGMEKYVTLGLNGAKSRVSATNMGPIFLFVFDRLNIAHYLISNSSIDGKFHTQHHYIVEIGKKKKNPEHKLYIKVLVKK